MEKQTLRQILADYYDVPAEDVAPELFDPAVKFLKEGHEGPSEAGIWVLDPDAQKTLLDYLEKRSSGQLIEEGEAEADTWDEFVYWAQRFYELPGFDQNERDYKLEISENINRARAAMQADAEDWPQLLKKAFGPPTQPDPLHNALSFPGLGRLRPAKGSRFDPESVGRVTGVEFTVAARCCGPAHRAVLVGSTSHSPDRALKCGLDDLWTCRLDRSVGVGGLPARRRTSSAAPVRYSLRGNE